MARSRPPNQFSIAHSIDLIKTELDLYYGQLKIKNEIANRKIAFEAEMTAERLAFEESQRMMREAFEKEAVARQDEVSNSFLQRIKVCRMVHFSSRMLTCSQSEGIEEIRKRIVPAYTFTKFPKLPLELRLYIWNLLCRTDDASTFILVNTEASRSFWDHSLSAVPEGSTQCIQPTMSKHQRSVIHGKAPIAMRVCKESRAERKKVYELSCTARTTRRPSRTADMIIREDCSTTSSQEIGCATSMFFIISSTWVVVDGTHSRY